MNFKLDTVDNIPFIWWPFVAIYWLISSFIILGLWFVIHHTIRVEFEGLEHCQSRDNFIFCGRHRIAGPLFSAYDGFGKPMVFLTNWSWYLKGLHLLFKSAGLDVLVPGMTGQGGKEGADKVVEYLKNGYSTIIAADTPGDAPDTVRNGASYLAMKSEVPIIPINAEAPLAWVWFWSWDKKRLPLPFSTVKITFKEPIVVTKKSYKESIKILGERLP